MAKILKSFKHSFDFDERNIDLLSAQSTLLILFQQLAQATSMVDMHRAAVELHDIFVLGEF